MPRPRPDDGAVTELGRLVESTEKLAKTADGAIQKFDGNTELIRNIVNDLVLGYLKVRIELASLLPPKIDISLVQSPKSKHRPSPHD